MPKWSPWALYLPMGSLGAWWAWWSRHSIWRAPGRAWFGEEPGVAACVGMAAACATALITVGATRVLVQRARWARRLHLSLRGALAGASTGHVAALAGLSSVAEELFFRAALAPSLGLWAGAVVFGLAHISPPGTYFAWTLWATLMGVVFHVLFFGSGTLLVPILAHAAINYENMQYIIHYDPTPLDMDRL